MATMKKKSGILLLLSLIILNLTAVSQVQVERSKEKVVISGVPCYLHNVKKGETAYSISRAYGISVDDLEKQNPVITQGVNEGQSLKIPVSIIDSAPPSQPKVIRHEVHDNTKYIYHILQAGETIYSLSRRYGITESELLQANPGLDISKLSLGTELAVPRKETPPPVLTTQVHDQDGYYHKVVKGETLSSISRKYGVTVKDLRKENRDIRFPQVGDFIKIPGMQAVKSHTDVVTAEEVAVDVPEKEPEIIYGRPAGYTPVGNLEGSFDVAVLLPFYINENSKRTDIDSSKSVKGKKVYKVINRTDDWIYPRSLGFIELYEGILIAADSLRSLGLNINLHVFDIKSDTVEVTRLVRSGKLDEMDLIIGPVHSSNLAIVASHAGKFGIPVVSPVSLLSNSTLSGNPTLFMATSSLDIVQQRMAGGLSKYYDNNFILIHADTTESALDGKRLKNQIEQELKYKMPVEEIRLKELLFYSRSGFGTDFVNQLSRSLSDKGGNVVVIASEDAPVVSESIMNVHNLSRRYNMKVFGYPYLRSLDNLDPKYYFDLGLMIYSPYWIDQSLPDVRRFNSTFRKRFSTYPSEMSYAWQGYDITYYFLTGLALHGKSFLAHPSVHNPDLLHTEFDFRRKSESDGFENQKLFLIRYTNNYDIELVEEK